MVTLRDRRWIAAASVAALGAVIGAGLLALQPQASARLTTGGERGALQVRQDAGVGSHESAAPLRCFVEGRFVGSMTIDRCAQKNGVSSQALDVGIATAADSPSAEPSASSELAPSPAADASSLPARADAAPSPQALGDACLRFGSEGWRTVGRRMPLAACVRALYDGRCVEPGDALYGRSGELTLRLVAGRVESSNDDRRFSFVMTQNDDCTLER